MKNESYTHNIKYTVNNISGADLADIQLLSKFKKGICFLLCIIDIFSKYAWVASLKDKKSIKITDVSQKTLINLDLNQTRYWLIKAANFTIKQWNHRFHKMM